MTEISDPNQEACEQIYTCEPGSPLPQRGRRERWSVLTLKTGEATNTSFNSYAQRSTPALTLLAPSPWMHSSAILPVAFYTRTLRPLP